jgi:16S rRNA (guanine966-N2)-methyltransferase
MRTPASFDQESNHPRRENELRIIGGTFGGRILAYHGDPVTRPMKHRVREAIFNLVSTESEGRHALDIFAGTGALGLEALSRGAKCATFVERHVPTARIVRQNIETLGVEAQTNLIMASAFVWAKRDLPSLAISGENPESPPTPWLVFVSPPYAMFVERQAEMLALIEAVARYAPEGSTMVVESDHQFDSSQLASLLGSDESTWTWDARSYPPALVAIGRKAKHSHPV